MARDDFTSQLLGIMEQYTDEVTEEISEIMEDIANEAKADWKAAAPKRTGAYRKSLRLKKQSQNGTVSAEVYAASPHYRLTHLLENGHLSRSGKPVQAQPHIEQVNEQAQQELLKRIEKVLK